MDVYVDGNNVGDSPCDKVSEGLTSIVKLLSASSSQNELVRISSSSGKLMCQIRINYYNNK